LTLGATALRVFVWLNTRLLDSSGQRSGTRSPDNLHANVSFKKAKKSEMKNCVQVFRFLLTKIAVEFSTLLLRVLEETGSSLDSEFTVPTVTISPCFSPSREMVVHILITTKFITRNRDSVVSIATSYGLDDRGVGVRVPVLPRIFSSANRLYRL
jgi:hypothetical protein